MSLNDTTIKALKPRSDRYEMTDRDGLLLEVHPSGKRVWRYRYRLAGKREKLTIGAYPAVGLKEARLKRDEAEKEVAAGKSPALAKRRLKALNQQAIGSTHTMGEEKQLVYRDPTGSPRNVYVYTKNRRITAIQD